MMNGTFSDGRAMKRGGWGELDRILSIKIRRMRALQAATKFSVNITQIRNNERSDAASSFAVIAESKISLNADGEDPTIDAVIDWERWDTIQQAINQLSPKQQNCLRRHLGMGFDPMSMSEIAQLLGLHKSTVFALVERAKKHLRESLKQFDTIATDALEASK